MCLPAEAFEQPTVLGAHAFDRGRQPAWAVGDVLRVQRPLRYPTGGREATLGP